MIKRKFLLLYSSNVINLLTVIPCNCYAPIVQPAECSNGKNVYQNMDMSAICVLLRFLDQRLEKKFDQDSKTNLTRDIPPVVTALLRLVKSEKIIRKYVKLQVKARIL